MSDLDQKINAYFKGKVVRKDLVKKVRGNAIVPTYVLEYLLGQYCATDDINGIEKGIENVKAILAEHYVHRNESELIKSKIKENRSGHKVIDKISVKLNEKIDAYEAQFSNLGIRHVLVDNDTVKRNEKLLVSGVWCIANLCYEFLDDARSTPWVLNTIKPIQLSYCDFDEFLELRRNFTTDEWIDFLIQSIGFNPDMLERRSKFLQLARLIPFCERNYNLMELGPKGTGKSHIYSEFSPHGILISGGEVTVPKLFVNNSTGKIGLVGYWDVVAFDEFAGKTKKANKSLVDIMKNYMANKSFSRGIEQIQAEASMVFVGNTQHTLAYMLKHADLFDDLPQQFYDSAFLDRIHFYLPGWEVDIIRGEMFTDGYGFVVDYLAEILRLLREMDFSQKYTQEFELFKDISTRDRDGIQKTFSGLMKLLFPNEDANNEEIDEILSFAIEGRKRVKDQLFRIDSTYAAVHFGYVHLPRGTRHKVKTLEEIEYPGIYSSSSASTDEAVDTAEIESSSLKEQKTTLKPFEKIIRENQKGISYKNLFGDYLKNAKIIKITDPYIRAFYQIRNLMELLEVIAQLNNPEDEVKVFLNTVEDSLDVIAQLANLDAVRKNMAKTGIDFHWAFDKTHSIHASHILTDTGWKINLDRGLDIFQKFDENYLDITLRNQAYRACKAFECMVLRVEQE
jgi:ATP-dependent Lon protease